MTISPKLKSWILNHRLWIIPVLIVAIVTPFTPALDKAVASYYYIPEVGFPTTPFSHFMFTVGLIPSWLLFLGAVGLYGVSFVFDGWNSWRQPMLVVIYTFAIGSGLLINAVLKDHWGRPRPRQVEEFGGNVPYRAYYQPQIGVQGINGEKYKSFPSGHVSTGFFFFSAALAGRRLNRRGLELAGWTCAILVGVAMSITRISAGGHFFSDCLVSALLMWLVAVICDRILQQS